MEAIARKPYQGVWNIVRFNWHFYLIAIIVIVFLFLLNNYTTGLLHTFIVLSVAGSLFTIVISLLASYYIYDRSELYTFNWLDDLSFQASATLVNINAGFDESSVIIAGKYPAASFLVFDFYDPAKHTEPSIKRARKAYPAFPGTRSIGTEKIPLTDNSADQVFCIMSLHEIRNRKERIQFLQELKRILKPFGNITVVEHLRDLPNFLAYSIGFFHFFSKKEWQHDFNEAGLVIEKEKKVTSFISCYMLRTAVYQNQ